MTRRFRISLFVSLAAAVGLHVRPCALTLLHCCAPCAMECAAIEEVPRQAPDAPGGISLLTMRPALAAMLDTPALAGVRTAVAEGH